MKPLVTLTGDGTFRAPTPEQALRLELPEDPPLAALMRLRTLLGDDLEEQIATRLYQNTARVHFDQHAAERGIRARGDARAGRFAAAAGCGRRGHGSAC